MPGTNLTRAEATERTRLLTLEGYDVELDISSATDAAAATYPSTTTIRFSCSEPGASTFVDLIAESVREVTLNGRALDPDQVYADSRITLDALAAENELRVVADAKYMNTGEGLHRFFDPVDKQAYLYTQFEVPDARRVFATFEQPDLKGTFQLTVTAPADWQVVSNGTHADPEPTGAGTAVWRFTRTPRISTYITALVAGPYHVVRDRYVGGDHEVPLGVYCRQSLAEHLDADEIFTVTKQGFEFFEETFDYPYPFEKYDQLFVPEYNMGAMENAGCVTIRDEYVWRSRTTDAAYEGRANTILHELAHMWFGDLVTMAWWDDLWLNESFATYAAALCQAERTRWTNAWTTFANTEKTWAYRQDQLPSTHPIAADIGDLHDVEVNFDGITYAKGASVLKQLVAYVGRAEFFAGLRHYFKAHEWRNATLADLRGFLESTSGRDLASWSQQWLETSGVNTLRAEFATDADGAFTSFAVRQEATDEHPTLRPHRLAIGLYDRGEGGLTRRTRVEIDIDGERTEVPDLVGETQPDLVLLNEDDLTYAKIRLDERSLATLVDHIGELGESLPRALCWSAAWDMCRDAEMAARDYVQLVLRGVGTEPDINMVQVLLRTAGQAARSYVAPERQAESRLAWADGLLPLARDAEPGSDAQLALIRSFAAAAITDEHVAILRGLLDGTGTLTELAVDADLRWTLVAALARLGAIGESDIDAEYERDMTILGKEKAAGARSALPDAAVKERVWSDIVDHDEIPTQTKLSMILGFWQVGQDELLAPYVDRYLEVTKTIWERLEGSEGAQHILQGLFPRTLTTQDTAERVRAWLSEGHSVQAARRLVSEGLADVDRALRAQERDALA